MTPTQQLLAKLRECETTMTKGEWHTHGEIVHAEYKVGNSHKHHWVASTDEDASGPRPDALPNAHGIATLKNSNPTVIAMLERAIGALENVRDLMTKDNYLSGVGITAYDALADLDALAREALKEKTDGK